MIPVQSEADIPLANEQIEMLNDDVTFILPKDATPTQIDQFEDKIDKINPDYKTCQNADNTNLTENCNATFTTKNALIQHSSIHEGILYCCLICHTYEASSRMSMKMHLRKEHTDLLGKNINWDSVKQYVKQK